MDKILLTAFLSALLGFITAVMSIVKLVNEKENKISDYRQAWTDTARSCLSDLIARLHAYAGAIDHQGTASTFFVDLVKKEDEATSSGTRITNFVEESLKESLRASRDMRREIYESYSLAQLHFKPNDLSFNRIEQKFDIIMAQLEDLSDLEDKAKKAALKQKIHGEINNLTNYSRDILKTEWESVKKGEPAYKKTKEWSIRGGIVLLFILISIGLHAGISISKAPAYANTKRASLDIKQESNLTHTDETVDKEIPSLPLDTENNKKP